jgi:2'-5' RNA ligase
MAVAVELLFDDAAAASVRELWARLDAAGIASLSTASHRRHRPHVTLLNASILDVTSPLIETLRPLVGTDLFFDSLATFPGTASVLFLGARATLPLLSAHAAVHELISSEQTELWQRYRPGMWVPHCTLAGGLDSTAISRAFGLLHPFQSLPAHVAKICAVDTETGDHTLLAAV